MGDDASRYAQAIEIILKKYIKICRIQGVPRINFTIIRSNAVIIYDNPEDKPEKIRDFCQSFGSCIILAAKAKEKKRVKRIISRLLEKGTLVIDDSLLYGLFKKEEKKDFLKKSVWNKIEKSRKMKDAKSLVFSIRNSRADIFLSDIKRKKKTTNFKVNYGENIIPFWISEKIIVRDVYAILCALSVAEVMGINLADISQKIKEGKIF